MRRRGSLRLLGSGIIGIGTLAVLQQVSSERPKYVGEDIEMVVERETIQTWTLSPDVTVVGYDTTLKKGDAAAVSVRAGDPFGGPTIDRSEVYIHSGQPQASTRFDIPDGIARIAFRIQNRTIPNIDTREQPPVSVLVEPRFY